jgi:hypothetical protein
MNVVLGVLFVLFGLLLIATPNLRAELHERLNSKFRWTQ